MKCSLDEWEYVYLQEDLCHPGIKHDHVARGCNRNGLLPPSSSVVLGTLTGRSAVQEMLSHLEFSCSKWLVWSETLLSSATNQKCVRRSQLQSAWHRSAPL